MGRRRDMFNRELNAEVASLKYSVERLDARYWELWHKHQTLVDALGMVPEKYTIDRYIKKGGPERAP
jgi:hypothetical protein